MGDASEAPIRFAPQQASGNETLAGAQSQSMNVFLDAAGAIRKRPGLRLLPGGPQAAVDSSGLIGVYRALNGDLYGVGVAGAERPIYRAIGASVSSLGPAPAGLRGTGRPTFAETEMILAIAGGDLMQKVELSGGLSSRLGGNPPVASHVITKSLRLLANDTVVDRTKVRYSDIASGTTTYAGNELWTPGPSTSASYFSAEARPDAVVALAETAELVYVLGATTTEVYIPDATQIFSRVAVHDTGCSTPYAVARAEANLYWLDQLHQVRKGSDQGAPVISQPIQGDLDTMDVTGAFAYRVNLGALDAIVFTFPADGRSFAYQDGVGWAQWSSWDGTSYTQHIANCQDTTGLVGTTTGYFAEYSHQTFDDLGMPIRAYIQSGFQDQGSSRVKDCKRVLLGLKRGPGTEGEVALLSWRDRPGPWEEPLTIDLGSSTDTDIVVDFSGLGTYRRREWRFEFTSRSELSLVSAVEVFEVTEA
jgi:hypothetical protein